LFYIKLLAVLLVSYLLGSIPFGYVVGRLQGIDVTRYGSGRTGGTNVGRLLGWRGFLLTAVGDLSKAMLAVLLARLMLQNEWAAVAAGLAAIIGHDWSLYLDGRGGRGVGSSFAVLLLFSPLVALAGLIVFGLVILWKRYVSLGSLTGTAAALVGVVLAVAIGGQPAAYLGFALVAAPLIFFQHRDNIQRLLAGTERRVGEPVTIKT
jgi:glycerol-3-phosphate acyltransferase PlsY